MTDNELTKDISKLNKSQINQRDIFGRTLLHLAASVGKYQLVEQILDHAHTDPSLSDYESGYSALHRAFLSGNISCAQVMLRKVNDRSQLLRLIDRDNLSPLDLLSEHFSFSAWDSKIGGSDLFTFGSNANHTLGFADPDDRSNPQMVKLRRNGEKMSSRARFRPIRILDVKVSKQHSAILTDQSTGNLLICGIPTEGRLGMPGPSSSTQFSFSPIPTLLDERIVSVALSIDHSVAVNRSGDVFTWGSNKYGQLGYTTSSTKQYSPRKVAGDLKKTRLSGCAASRIHTVVFNESDMFVWGTNAGQLGFSSTDEVVSQPRLVLHLPSNIVMVSATEVATVTLFDNHDVWVFMNGERFKVPFQVDRFNNSKDSFDVFRPRRANEPCYVTKIAAQGPYVCALFNHGAVYGFSLEKFHSSKEQPMKPSHIVKSLKIHSMWVGRTAHKCAVDVDIGEDGSVIICTEAGYVYRKFKRKGAKNKFERVPLINRIQQVRCDQIFGSFAAIRQDVVTEPYPIPVPTTSRDFHYLVPFVDYSSATKVNELLRGRIKPVVHTKYIIEQRRKAMNDEMDDESDDDDESDREEELEEEKRGKRFVKSEVNESLLRWLRSFNPDSLKMQEQQVEDNNDRGYDMDIIDRGSKVKIPAHRVIIGCRSSQLAELMDGKVDSFDVPNVGIITYDRYKRQLVFDRFQLEAVVIFLYYFYTDHVIAVWDTYPAYGEPPAILKAKTQLLETAKFFKLEHLRAGILRRLQPAPSLNADLLKIGNSFADVAVKLKDGQTIFAHSYILKARSSYFATLLSGRWDLQKDPQGRIEINQTETSTEVFKVIMTFIYGDKQVDLLNNEEKQTSKDFIRFVLDVLVTADQLSLLRLKDICQCILSDFLNVTNAGWMLEKSVDYDAGGLRDRVLHYICQNIDCIMENGFLSELPEDLFSDIDERLKLYQGQFVKAHGGLNSQIREFLNDINGVNDFMTRIVPLYGSRDQRKLSISHFNQQRRASSNGKLPPIEDLSLTESVPTSQRRRSSRLSSSGASAIKEALVSKSSPVATIEEPPQTSSTPSPVPQKKSPPIPSSPLSLKPKSSPKLASWSDPKTTPSASTVSPMSIGEIYNKQPSSSSSQKSNTAKIPTATPTKLSQKERKKLQRETPHEVVGHSNGNSSPWNNGSMETPWKALNSNQPETPDSSPFAMYKNKGKTPSKPAVPPPTLGDIIQQEQKKVEIQAQQNTKSLKEIQQEEEFDKWWARESERQQKLEQARTALNQWDSNNKNGPSNRSRGRGRGNRGKGPSNRGTRGKDRDTRS